MVLACGKMVDSDNKVQLIGMEQGTGGTDQMNEKSKSTQLSTTWSYQTSTDPWTAGAMSDVFVVPNLNVMYEEVSIVEWISDQCKVKTLEDNKTLPTTTTFNIEAPENKPALAFYSRYHIENIKLPELQKSVSDIEYNRVECKCGQQDEIKKEEKEQCDC